MIYIDKINFIEKILIILLLVNFYFDFSPAGLYYSKNIIIIIMYLYTMVSNRNLYVNKNIVLYYLFCILCISSLIYNPYGIIGIGNIVSIVIALFLMISLNQIIYKKGSIELIFNIIIVLSIILSIRVFYALDFSKVLQSKYDPAKMIQDNIGNRNQVAFLIGLGVNFCIYKFLYTKIEKRNKISLFIIISVLLLSIFVSGSRGGLLFTILPTIILYFYNIIRSKNITKKVKSIAMLIFIGILFLWACFNIEIIYNTVGFRIENTYKDIIGERKNDTDVRFDMIDKGLTYFSENPIVGTGISSYSKLYGEDTGFEVYSHNNFIEIIVNTGMIGFSLYYGYLITTLVICNNNRIKTRCIEEKKYYLFIIVLFVSKIILDIAKISYYDYLNYFIICLVQKKRVY